MSENKYKAVFIYREVYGKVLYYPSNDAACLFTALTKQKTLSQKQLDYVDSLGFAIEIIPYTYKLESQS